MMSIYIAYFMKSTESEQSMSHGGLNITGLKDRILPKFRAEDTTYCADCPGPEVIKAVPFILITWDIGRWYIIGEAGISSFSWALRFLGIPITVALPAS